MTNPKNTVLAFVATHATWALTVVVLALFAFFVLVVALFLFCFFALKTADFAFGVRLYEGLAEAAALRYAVICSAALVSLSVTYALVLHSQDPDDS